MLVAVIIFDIYLGIKSFEYIYCASIRHQPPLVASNQHERQLVVDQIKTKYPEAKNICELGSGFGGLARTIARNTKANVYALENMPFSAFVSKKCDIVLRCKNNHTIFGDAFEYLKTTDYPVGKLDEFPLLDNKDVLVKDDIFRILRESGVGVPAYYDEIPFEVDGKQGTYCRSRSGCYFCFFQQKIEWI